MTGRPLPHLSNPWTWALPALAAVLLAALAATGLDRSLFLTVNGWAAGLPPWLWANLTALGDSLVIFTLALLLVGRRPKTLWALIVAAIVGALLVHGLKEWLLIRRPPGVLPPDTFNVIGRAHVAVSFPSGHTTAVFTLVALLCLLEAWGDRIKLLLVAAAAAVGVSRIAVGVHWPTDVLGGALVGWLSAVVGVWLAPRVPWGTTIGAQRLIAGLLVIAAAVLVFAHESGYSDARALEIGIGVVVLAAALPRLRRLYAGMRIGADPELPAVDRRSGRTGLAIRILVTALLFVLIFRAIDLDGVVETVRDLVPRLLLLGIVMQLFAIGLAGYRWHLVMRRLGFEVDAGFCISSYFKGMFFSQGLPTSIGGDAIRVLDVAREGHRKRDALAAVVVDRGIGVLGLLVINLAAIAFAPHLLPPEITLLIAAITGGGIVGFLLFWGLHRVRRLAGWRLLVPLMVLSERLARVLAGARSFATQLGLSMAVHFLVLLAIFLIGRSVELEYGFFTYLVLVPPVLLLTIVPVSMAGWGIREGAMIGLFVLIGGDKTLVLSMSILYGLALILASLPGLYIYLTSKNRL